MIVLDTHVWLWWVIEDKKHLRSPMRRRIRHAVADETVAVSAISMWEIATKVALGKLQLSCDVDTWFTGACQAFPQITVESLSARDAIESTRLPGDLHRDPADRIIVTLARRLGARLATLDAALIAYPHVQKL